MSAEDFVRDIQKLQLDVDVGAELALYTNTGDARFIWRAVARCHAADAPLPPVIVDKLAQWAALVQPLAEPAALVAALELSGSAKSKIGPKHSAAYRRRWRLAGEVSTVMRMIPDRKPNKGKLRKALAIVAHRRGLSVSVVKAAYHQTVTADDRGADKLDRAAELQAALRAWR